MKKNPKVSKAETPLVLPKNHLHPLRRMKGNNMPEVQKEAGKAEEAAKATSEDP